VSTADPAGCGPAGEGPPGITDPDHIWRRTMIGWQIAFWTFIGVAAIVLARPDDLTAGQRAIGYLAIAAIALAYLLVRPGPDRDLAGRNLTYLLVVVVAVGVACAVDPNLSLLLFIAYSQMWMFSGEVRNGVVLTAALTVSSLAGFLTADGWNWGSLSYLGPTMAVSVVFSLLMGIWVSRIIDQSRERAELIQQLEATRSELGDAHHAQGVAAERERMAREIHDTLAQGFTSIIMLAQTARAELEAQVGAGTPAAARLDSIELVARENLGEARALVAAFSPVALEGTTLTDAVRRLAERFGTETGVAIDVEVSGRLGALSRDREVVLLRAAQEALTNVRRHAHAQLVTVRLIAEGSQARVEVVDDGVGFEAAAPVGFGLTGMRDRVQDAGGELDVASAPGAGTRVSVRIPVAP
jgi:signal transduction histidine kinase